MFANCQHPKLSTDLADLSYVGDRRRTFHDAFVSFISYLTPIVHFDNSEGLLVLGAGGFGDLLFELERLLVADSREDGFAIDSLFCACEGGVGFDGFGGGVGFDEGRRIGGGGMRFSGDFGGCDGGEVSDALAELC